MFYYIRLSTSVKVNLVTKLNSVLEFSTFTKLKIRTKHVP